MVPVLAQIAGVLPATEAPASAQTTGGGAGGAAFPLFVLLLVIGIGTYLVAVWRNPNGKHVPGKLRRNLLKAAQEDVFDQVRKQTNDQISKGMLITLPEVVVVTAPPEVIKRLETSEHAVRADLVADIEEAYDFSYDDPGMTKPKLWFDADPQVRRLTATVYFNAKEAPERSRTGRTVTAAVAVGSPRPFV